MVLETMEKVKRVKKVEKVDRAVETCVDVRVSDFLVMLRS